MDEEIVPQLKDEIDNRLRDLDNVSALEAYQDLAEHCTDAANAIVDDL